MSKLIRTYRLAEYDTYCACGFHGHGNGRKPPRCPACGRTW